jgi:oligoribonuclease
MAAAGNLVWIDLEMTGLDPDNCVILEIATIVTDSRLNELALGPELALATSEELLQGMDEWNQTHHSASGLLERVRASTVTMQEAERLTLDFLKPYTNLRESPLCGNSIGQDRRFLLKHMPTLHDWFHYRSVDVSTIKELSRRWYPQHMQPPSKKGAHRALDDIRESIAELRFYKEHLFVKHPSAG